jgi:HD-GYP domain-containing protein (c-di-GMP phosphodiesterase class II)
VGGTRDDFLTPIASALELLQCGALIAHCDGRIAYANARVAEWLSLDVARLRGMSLADLTTPESRDELRRRIHNPDPGQFEFELVIAGGLHLSVLAGLRSMAPDGPAAEYRVATLFDASAVRASERRATAQYEAISRLSDTVLEQALALKGYSRELEERVRERTEELRRANMDSIYTLALASEARDADTGAHVLRIQEFSRRLAESLGHDADECERIGYSAILHDVGKIVIPDAIIKKPGPLTQEERLVMQQHTIEGERILPDTPFFALARRIARWHHENFDGSGYPDGIAAEQIPLEARIVHLVDVCDALLFPRVYKPAWSREQTGLTLKAGAGSQFDPLVAAAFRDLWLGGGLEDIFEQARAQAPSPA